ncbi:S41 family peptidase [uncultured Porphyromonas sp.]|uniref:S41 family peptidase n=1 Tax=uncultured Porphyromonas sp. TaxID=159274 RepID=UPI0025D321B3|nr:S41 family peptidase [uncultured Porphyromonas sp.]
MKRLKYLFWFVVVLVLSLLGYGIVRYARLLENSFEASIFPSDPCYRMTDHSVCLPDSTVSERERELFYIAKLYGLIEYKSTSYKEKYACELLYPLLQEVVEGPVSIKSFNDNLQKALQRELARIGAETRRDSLLTTYEEVWVQKSSDLTQESKMLLGWLAHAYTQIDQTRASFATYHKSNGPIRRKGSYRDLDWRNPLNRLIGLFDFYAFVYYFYPNRQLFEQPWDLSLQQAIPMFLHVENEVDYHKAIRYITARLNDSHASHSTAMDTLLFGERRAGFRMRSLSGRWFVYSKRSANYPTNVKIGDEVLSVNSIPIKHLSDSLALFVSASNASTRDKFLNNAILSTPKESFVLKIRRNKDTLEVKERSEHMDYFNSLKLEEEGEMKPQWLNDSVAYWHLASAKQDNVESFYRQVCNAQYIILDLRCYPYPSSFWELSKCFIPQTENFSYIVYPDSQHPGEFKYVAGPHHLGSENYYKGNVILIVDNQTESFSEYLCMMLQKNPKAITVGTSSSGANGNVHLYEFPGGVMTFLTGLGVLDSNYFPMNGRGVKIDVPVLFETNTILTNVDPYLSKAIEQTLCAVL